MRKFIATFSISVQVGPDDFELKRPAVEIIPDTKVSQIIEWYDRFFSKHPEGTVGVSLNIEELDQLSIPTIIT